MLPEETGGQAIPRKTIPGVQESQASKVYGRTSQASCGGGGVQEGRRYLPSALAASGCVDVFAPLPMWASCSREPAVSWLLLLSSGVVLGRRRESGFHCIRLHLPEIEAFWVTPGRRIALEMGTLPLLSLLNEGSCAPVVQRPGVQGAA